MSYISKLGLGGSKFGSISGLPMSDSESLIQRAWTKGIRFYDTANIYGQGDSERAMAPLLKLGDDVIVGTKGGYSMPQGASGSKGANRIKIILRHLIKKLHFLKRLLLKVRSRTTSTQNFSYEYLKAAAEESASRLGVTQLPLYMLHSPSKEDLMKGEGLASLYRLKQEGLISQIGVALLDVFDLKSVTNSNELDCIQVQLNILSPASSFSFLKTIKESSDIQIVVRQPYAGGLLIHTSIENENENTYMHALHQCAKGHQLTVPDLALMTMLHCPFIDKVLVGTTKEVHLDKNIEIANSSFTIDAYNEVMELMQKFEK